ncbi:hypothetical protein N431DRAFT_478014 [Stipitochalara longipes BDJ]|nr:hypothetical protein N431DRAFT_478014 [Stipitochalara longipes BDJ]
MNIGEDSKELRNRQTRAVRAKAPLAANFEDCLQAFDRLRATIQSSKKDLEDEYILGEDCYSRLKNWGQHSGASSRALDHRLRKCSELGTATLDLLSELGSILQETNELCVSDRDPSEHHLDVDESVSNSTEEIGINDDRGSESDVRRHLEDVREVVDCLLDLLPSLCDPVPEGNHEKTASSEDAAEDIELAMFLFPAAPPSLNDRLGRAHWQRRRNLKQIRPRSFPLEITKPAREADQSVTKARPRSKNHAKPFAKYRRHAASRGTSDAGKSITSSNVETIFSRTTFFGGHSATSIAESDDPYKILFFTPPTPPIPLILGSCFSCPYCRLEINVGDQITTDQDWLDHVYLDLEPYLCTFDNCIRADKLFGVREDWFQHELYSHRIPKAWLCSMPLCKKLEFSDQDIFEQHLKSAHKDLFASDRLNGLIQNCERYSELPLPQQTCVLCGSTCSDARGLEHHVATHLEQFALTAIADESSSEDEGNPNDKEDLVPQESPADFLLHEFVQEQTGFFPPRLAAEGSPKAAIQPLQITSEQKSASEKRASLGSFQPGTSDTSSVAGNAANATPKKEKEELWAGKVEAFLGKQTEVDQAAHLPSTPTVRSNVPPRNANFVGRTANLTAIQSSLASRGQICAVSGRGGIGKTSTIVEYSYRYEEDYDYIFWVDAETTGGRADTYNLIASTLKLGGDIIHDQDGLTILVREFLQCTDKTWLLVFDNAENWPDISNYVPQNFSKTHGSILISTRKPEILKPARNFHSLEIELFTLEESRQLLLCSMQPSLDQNSLHKHPEFELAATASKLVDRLPLAISMIAGYVQVSRCTLSEFLEIWDERQSRSRKITSKLENEAIDALWDIGFRELSLNARQLLKILAFLDSESIPKDLLVDDHKEPFLEFLNSSETIRYRRMIAELSGRRLVHLKEQRGKPTLSIHRLLQEKILHDFEGDKLNDAFGKAYCLVRKRLPPASPIQVPEPNKVPECKKCIAHVLSLRRAFNTTPGLEPSFNLARLFYDAGFHMWELQTAPEEGILFLETAEGILNSLDYDPHARIRADIHAAMAVLYSMMGINFRTQNLKRLREARAIRQKVHELQPANFDSDLLLTNAASDLGYFLFETWEYEEAGKLFQACYQKYCKWGPETEFPFEYFKHYYNNARLCMYRGDYSEAINLFRRGIALVETALGKESWHYSSLQFNLACTMLQTGDLQSALEIHSDVLAGHERTKGKYNSATLMSNYAVGAVYYHLKNFSAAAEYMEECIQLGSLSKWSEEALARARYHLSKIYAEQAIKEEERQKLEEQATIVLRKYPTPKYLVDIEDKMMLFDDLQSAAAGRFTNRGLLAYMQNQVRSTLLCISRKERPPSLPHQVLTLRSSIHPDSTRPTNIMSTETPRKPSVSDTSAASDDECWAEEVESMSKKDDRKQPWKSTLGNAIQSQSKDGKDLFQIGTNKGDSANNPLQDPTLAA